MNTPRFKLLIVDDEEFNREILQEMLSGAGYEVELAVDGEEAWTMLDTQANRYSAVLLDRMMPRLDWMGLLARMKQDDRYVDLPVIFQTAIDHPLDIAAGIKAGAFYYLVKPVDEHVLFAIVQSAVSTFEVSRRVRGKEASVQVNLSSVLQRCEFKLHTLQEARALATELSAFYPQPQRTCLGIMELLINAVEHGNLAISYQEKTNLLRKGIWEGEVSRRLVLPEYAAKSVAVILENKLGEIRLTVSDEGEGFDCKKYMDISPERAFDPNGRGIAMSNMMSFDSLEYKGKGNQLLAIVKI
jgi:CheY-like chemotaxis protein